MATTTLGNKATGSIIKLNENGKAVEFYVAKHDYESGLNGPGRTLVVRKDCCDIQTWDVSRDNAYANSDIDSWLNNTYKNMLDADIRGDIGATKFYYTPGNGNNSTDVLSRAIFLLSLTELGQFNDRANVEGEVLPINKTLKIAYMNGGASGQHVRSPYVPGPYIWWVTVIGNISHGFSDTKTGVRPIFTLPASRSVGDDGTVSVNTAPTITSSTPSGANLGVKNEPFAFTYAVQDTDGDTVTVKEYLDTVVKRSYTAVLGQENTFQDVNQAENFQKVLNGNHTLKVVANDGKADSAAYTVSFVKKVTGATITPVKAMAADAKISVMIMHIEGDIPDDAKLEVLVTNNANDDSPAWEDATAEVKSGKNYVFQNQTAKNGFAINFKVSVNRGPSDRGGYITMIGGAFE